MMNLWLINFDDAVVKPPTETWEWMQTKTSITEKAKHECQSVRLELLDERWAHHDDRFSGDVFIREINMYCDEKLAWYARTKIPKKTYESRADKFKSLHGQPIAKILYNDPEITREDFVYAYLTPAMPEYQWAIKNAREKPLPDYLWARKSVFRIEGEPLYLMEIFFNVP